MAQDSTALNRAEVGAVKTKLAAVRDAMGGIPPGYALESEDFSLPTNFNPARKGKFWPISSSVYLRYTDKALQDAEANAEQAAADFHVLNLANLLPQGDRQIGEIRPRLPPPLPGNRVCAGRM